MNALLDRYLDMLLERNRHVNLVGRCTREEAGLRHIADSLAPLGHPAVSALFAPGALAVDVGAGGGLPGIPLSIARPQTRFTLVDALRKRVDFLSDVIPALELNAEAVHARAEDFASAPGRRESFDIALSRAVADTAVLLEYLLPLLKVGGTAILYKGPKADEELGRARRALFILGGEAVACLPVALPDPSLDHRAVLVRKLRRTPGEYPRKAGLPEKKPL